MSRSTSKAQADKSKAPPRVSPPPSHEPEEEDIIPGCLTQSQWMDMLVQEEAEDVVGEIMADLMTKVMEGCYSVHIERQLSSFTAYWAKDYFIKTVEQKIMCRDRGEDSMELSATEDSEPIPITPDVWAEGCFPVIHGAPPSEPESPQRLAGNQFRVYSASCPLTAGIGSRTGRTCKLHTGRHPGPQNCEANAFQLIHRAANKQTNRSTRKRIFARTLNQTSQKKTSKMI
ncbi:uncharacterized protein C2orf81 homolog isoform X2 [Syngnathoides biaculeatus]|uniref:uncharacterized protein C2orf81 homolog isoform X2 n=1 Tax=Syngnathoides biaculeatus TaxID=300417 RepID=UPI002ADD9A79|nr:uncharacterized protein C2orf81 homolog isoform X2 [Syngnathoides biaculeatus]